jgi:hypothetical protein
MHMTKASDGIFIVPIAATPGAGQEHVRTKIYHSKGAASRSEKEKPRIGSIHAGLHQIHFIPEFNFLILGP